MKGKIKCILKKWLKESKINRILQENVELKRIVWN